MVSARKRGRHEMEAVVETPKEPSLIERIRNMWEFANLAQWIFIFGRVVKIDENLGIEVHPFLPLPASSTTFDAKLNADNDNIGPGDGMSEKSFHPSTRDWSCSTEICVITSRPHVSISSFCVIKLTLYSPEIFDEYTRRQYVAKAPARNPFGTDEEPAKFTELDILTKVGHNAQRGMVDSAHLCDIRSAYYNSSHSGSWAILIVFEREWKNKRTASRRYGYVWRF